MKIHLNAQSYKQRAVAEISMEIHNSLVADRDVLQYLQYKSLKFKRNGGKSKQGRIHGSISRVRVGRGSIVVGQGQ